MKTADFNNFFRNLQKDKTYEMFGFAFLRMTDRQAVKLIDYYKSIGEAEEKQMPDEKMYIVFGTHRQLTFSLDTYNKLKNNSGKEVLI